MWAEIKRKLFHLCGLVYVIGLIYLPRDRYLMLLFLLLTVEFIFEIVRIKFATINERCVRTFGGILRPSEQNRLSGVFWMLLGVTVVANLLKPVSLATVSLLYLLFGDAAASLVGKRVGGLRWPNSEKSLAGSAACFVMCVFIGNAMIKTTYGWSWVVIGAAVATAVEVLNAGVNDNFLIPVASAVTFLLLGS